MGEFERQAKFDLAYASCIYSGISKALDFDMEYGQEDRTEEFQYIVDRYCNEFIVSGDFLREKLEKYKKYVRENNRKKD